jgi:hypothetical protein
MPSLNRAIGAIPAQVTHPDKIAADCRFACEYILGTHNPQINIPAFVNSPATIKHSAGVVAVDKSDIKKEPEN